MGLRGRLRRLERQVGPPYETLYLPDGSEVRYTLEDLSEALASVVKQEQEPHWLVPIIRETEEITGLVGLINSLVRSEERAIAAKLGGK